MSRRSRRTLASIPADLAGRIRADAAVAGWNPSRIEALEDFDPPVDPRLRAAVQDAIADGELAADVAAVEAADVPECP